MSTIILMGVSIRPQAQPTAVVVTQVEWGYNIKTRKRQDHFTVRFMEVVPPKTAFPHIAERLGQIVDNLHLQAAQFKARVILFVDVTGIGDPVIDLIKARVDPLITCRFTANDKRTEHGDHITMGKAWLVSRLMVLFQGGRITIPRTPITKLLVEELLSYSLDPSPIDNELTATFIVGTQDHLLTALGLACQGLPESEQAAEEYLEFMRRRLHYGATPVKASKDLLKEWHGKSAVQGLNPLTLAPEYNEAIPSAAKSEKLPPNSGQ